MQLNAPGKIFIFQSKQACFLTGWSANIISRPTLFKRKQSKKIPIVDQTHGLTPFEKISIGRLGKILIFQSRQACFLSGWSGNIISRPILFKSKQRKKNPTFDQNHGLTPLKKASIGRLVKIFIFQSRQAFFLTGWSVNIISRPIFFKSKQRKNF